MNERKKERTDYIQKDITIDRNNTNGIHKVWTNEIKKDKMNDINTRQKQITDEHTQIKNEHTYITTNTIHKHT